MLIKYKTKEMKTDMHEDIMTHIFTYMSLLGKGEKEMRGRGSNVVHGSDVPVGTSISALIEDTEPALTFTGKGLFSDIFF